MLGLINLIFFVRLVYRLVPETIPRADTHTLPQSDYHTVPIRDGDATIAHTEQRIYERAIGHQAAAGYQDPNVQSRVAVPDMPVSSLYSFAGATTRYRYPWHCYFGCSSPDEWLLVGCYCGKWENIVWNIWQLAWRNLLRTFVKHCSPQLIASTLTVWSMFQLCLLIALIFNRVNVKYLSTLKQGTANVWLPPVILTFLDACIIVYLLIDYTHAIKCFFLLFIFKFQFNWLDLSNPNDRFERVFFSVLVIIIIYTCKLFP